MASAALSATRLGDWTVNESYITKENQLLYRLQHEPSLQLRLISVTESQLTPGLALIYPLQGTSARKDYGCHILRSQADGYTYLPTSDLRGGVKAGLFFTLSPTDL